MSILKKIINWISNLFSEKAQEQSSVNQARKYIPPVHFHAISFVGKSPKNPDILDGMMYCVVSSKKLKWSLFRCPCGCGSVVTLSLQNIHSPKWRLSQTATGRPTLHPSVWKDNGCRSHFWVKDGRIFWCVDAGRRIAN